MKFNVHRSRVKLGFVYKYVKRQNVFSFGSKQWPQGVRISKDEECGNVVTNNR